MRKKNFCAFALLLMAAWACVMTSCSERDIPHEPKARYTVMLYGCGGGSLDEDFFSNIKQAIAYGSTDDVKMTCEMKLSASYVETHDVGNMAGTFRMVLPLRRDTTGLDVFALPTTRIGDSSLPLYDPHTLADFIQWSALTAPAENYILVLWDHGNGWNVVNDKKRSRSILFDDNLDSRAMSLKECVQGIKESGIRLKVLLTDACNMHMLENLLDYATVADYAMGGVQLTPDYGTNYYNLLHQLNLAGTSDASLEEQLHRFADMQLAYWATRPQLTDYDKNELFGDMGLVDLRKLPAVASVVSDIAQELCATYDTHRDTYDQAAEETHRMQLGTSETARKVSCEYDAQDYFNQLAALSGNTRLKQLAQHFEHALAQAQYRVTSKPPFRKWKDNVSVGIIITNQALYEEFGYDQVYTGLEFDKQSRWSRWLKTNQHHPSGRLSYNDR